VNLLFAPELQRPERTGDYDDQTAERVQQALNPMREALGLPTQTTCPETPPNRIPEAIDVVLEEEVPVLSIGLGCPTPDIVEACHRRNVKLIAMVTTAHDAIVIEAAGLDAIVAQGAEAGGHRSHFEKPQRSELADIGTVALIPEVVDAVRIPVIAAGGVVDGRGLVSALALGAKGVLMGTRFVATRESMVTAQYKQALLEHSGENTALTDVLSGRFARAIRNTYIERYTATQAPVLPFPLQHLATADIRQKAAAQENPGYQYMWSGQGVGTIRDLPGAADVIETTITEARTLLMEHLTQTVQLHPNS
jgi:nitronate monooxygenase